MKKRDGKVSDINICYIGGGSRGWAWGFMADLALEGAMSGEVRLYDIDKVASKNNEIIGNEITKSEKSLGKWNYRSVDTIEEALKGSDFVIISILPGTFDEMDSDVHAPEGLGVYQSVGDTTGPGGMVRALRTIPMYVDIANKIKENAPDAWVINYTNPMSLCVKTLYEVYPKIKAIGCCHEVFGTQKLLAQMCKDEFGIEEVKREEIEVDVMGINHFTWLRGATYNGKDLVPLYAKYADQFYEIGYRDRDENWLNANFHSGSRVKFDLYKKYGYIAAAGDRHLAEFVANDLYLDNEETANKWLFSLTKVDWRKEELVERLERSKRLISGEEEIKLDGTGEEGVLIIKALAGLEPLRSNVNIINSGQISNLPIGAIVETNAYFSKDKVETVEVGAMPQELLELTMPHIQNMDYIYEAAITYNKDLVVKAFLNDPMFSSKCCDKVVAEELVTTMICNTRNYLPKEWN